MATYEFCSPEWVQELHDYIAPLLVGIDLSEVKMSAGEELTDPPAHLLKPGESTVGWHYRLDVDGFTTSPTPSDDVDKRMMGDYATVVRLARLPYSDPTFGPLALAALEDGSLRYEGEHTQPSQHVIDAIEGLHDYLAARTT